MNDATQEEWITTREAAALLGVGQVHNILRRFDCAVREYRTGNMWRRADVEAIRALLAEQTYTPRAKPAAVDNADRTVRPCMCCERPFPSEGIHNRLCAYCRHGDGLEFSLPRGRK